MVTRSELRNIFASAVEDAGKGLTVFNGRHIDNLATAMPAAIIALEEVLVEQDLADGFMFNGTLSVMLLVNGDDDYLDSFIDPVIAACMARMRLQLPGTGCRLDAIGYNRDIDPGVAAAALTWAIDYV